MIALHAIHDCDVEKVKSLNVDMEMPTLELPECTLKVLKERPSPRYIKSHLPFTLLPLGNCNRSYKVRVNANLIYPFISTSDMCDAIRMNHILGVRPYLMAITVR